MTVCLTPFKCTYPNPTLTLKVQEETCVLCTTGDLSRISAEHRAMHPWERSARRLAELDAAAAGAGARRWVEKTPIHVRYLEKLFLLRLVLAQSVDTKRQRRTSQMHACTHGCLRLRVSAWPSFVALCRARVRVLSLDLCYFHPGCPTRYISILYHITYNTLGYFTLKFTTF